MKRTPRAAAAFAALIGAFALSLSACTADVVPSAPRAPDVIPAASQPTADLLDLGGTIDGLGETLTGALSGLTLYECSTPSFGSVTQNVGRAGGVIRVGPHSLVIPPGALDHTVAITATTAAGQHVKVDFQPSGLRFKYRAVLRLSYAHCDSRPLLPKIVYIDDLLSILERLLSFNDVESESVTARLRHFSGYAIAD
ncbi:MAG: hypothetical protein M3282_03705 [Gemmatimonadota bacterium]|jgi:hypothetical protein|nr:hypothetical protein [Gemmatimonadota bacterium]